MYPVPSEPYEPEPAGGDDPVAGDDQREPVARAERAGGPLRVRVPGERGELAVGDGLARTAPPAASFATASWNGVHQSRSTSTPSNEVGSPREVRGEQPHHFRHGSVTIPFAGLG